MNSSDSAEPAASASPAAQQDWQPMESAPRDGRDFLIWNKENGIRKGRYFYRSDNDLPWSIYEGDGVNTFKGGRQPTHWRPLPPSPAALQAGGDQ